MSRTLQFIIFFIVFFGIYLAMHYYVFYRLFGLFNIERKLIFLSLVFGLALTFPVCSLVERFYDGTFCRILYIISSTWLGILFFCLTILLIFEVFNLFFSFNPVTEGIVIIAAVALLSGYSLVNGLILAKDDVTIPIENLDKDMTIVHLSDIHLGTIHNSDYLQKIVDKTNEADPDLVLITGDLIDGSGMIDEHSVKPLDNIRAPVFFTTGNHERYTGVGNITRILRNTKVRMLRDEMVEFQGVQIIGIDDSQDGFRIPNKEIGKIGFDKEKPSILMYHPPSGIKEANAAGIDLQLSGHTHNGQIIPFNLVVRAFYPYTKGLYDYNGTWLYVSTGTGTWGPPMRLGSRNLISVIHLEPKQA